MKFGVWSSYYYNLTPEEAVVEFAKHGFNYSEFSDEHSVVLMERGDDAYETGKKFAAFAAEHGMSFPQGHLLLRARICDEKSVDMIKKQIDLFHGIGVKNAVLHCDSMLDSGLTREAVLERNVIAVRGIADYAKDRDITICLENIFGTSPTQDVDTLLWLIEKIDRPNVGICLDTGHLNIVESGKQAEFICKAGKYLKALHLADNEGKIDQHLLPFSCGSVNMIEVIEETKKIGYEGLYNFEIPGESGHRIFEILGYKLDYIKKVFEYLDEVTSK